MQTMAADVGERWMTLTQAAAEANLTTGVFLRHMAAGHLPYRGVKMGEGRSAHWRIVRTDAEQEPVPEGSAR
jgi:hypothetical protein